MKNGLIAVGLIATSLVRVHATPAHAAPGPAADPAPEGSLPPPWFNEAMAAARRAGKPLVIDLGAKWCHPCKQLEAELQKPHGQAALQPVFFVRYDVDEPPGAAIKERFEVRAFPTLMVIDPDGREADRLTGTSDIAKVRAWLERAPEMAVSLSDCLARADSDTQNAALQLQAGKRLLDTGRAIDSRPYLGRAMSSDDAKVGSAATFALAEAEVAIRTPPTRRKQSKRRAKRVSRSFEARTALRLLATSPDPPSPLLERLIEERLAAGASQPEALEELVLYGVRGGALNGAVKAALRLEPLAGDDPRRLISIAEAYHAQGDRQRAVALAERALAAAPGSAHGSLGNDLARFRTGNRAPGPTVQALSAGPTVGNPRGDVVR